MKRPPRGFLPRAVDDSFLFQYGFGKFGAGCQHILRPHYLVSILLGSDAFEVENRRADVGGEGGGDVVHCFTSFIVSKTS